jgi:hypothetical protein
MTASIAAEEEMRRTLGRLKISQYKHETLKQADTDQRIMVVK